MAIGRSMAHEGDRFNLLTTPTRKRTSRPQMNEWDKVCAAVTFVLNGEYYFKHENEVQSNNTLFSFSREFVPNRDVTRPRP